MTTAGDALADFVETLRREDLGAVPGFDPSDGGADATVLLLLEKPSRAAVASGLVSRDNASASAASLRSFLSEAGLARSETCIWNAVPWWNGTPLVTAGEQRRGLAALARLLPLLARLRVAILVGRRAGAAAELVRAAGLQVITSAHMSPNVRAAFPDRWRDIPVRWSQARLFLG